MSEQIFTIGEVADRLRVSPQTIRRWQRQGRAPIRRAWTGRRRFTEADLRLLTALAGLDERQPDATLRPATERSE